MDKLKGEENNSGVDSGFISSEVIMSSEDISSVDPSDLTSQNNPHHHHKQTSSISSTLTTSTKSSGYYSRLDSGVEISDSISGLNLSSTEDDLKLKEDKIPHWTSYFTPDSDGDTALHLGILQGKLELVETLISIVPHPSILDFQNNLLQTGLHVAVISAQAGIARKLVAAGARVDMKDRNGNTPLHLACHKGDLPSLQALSFAISAAEIQSIQVSYTKFSQILPQCIDCPNYDGQSPVHLAAVGGHGEVLRALNWIGADMNNQEGKGGRTGLHYTVERNHLEALKVLVNECRVDLEIENYSRLTPYQLAACNDLHLFSKELINAGALPLSIPIDEDEDESCCGIDLDDDDEDISLHNHIS